MKLLKWSEELSVAQRIAISFVLVILVGSILLSLPIAHQPNQSLKYIDALFLATSATCLTGLTPVVIDFTLSWFGKIVLLVLIQIGGLGLMTIMSSFVLFLRNRISLKERHTLSEMFNRPDFLNVSQFIKAVIYITITIESIGVLLLLPVLIPRSGLVAGFGQSVFLAVSAFYNAGFDLFGATSLIGFQHHLYFQTIIMVLIVCGGLGFAVWLDLYDFFKNLIKTKNLKHATRKFSTHSKLVIMLTLILIFVPVIIMYLLEINNSQLFEGLNGIEQFFALLFQSVTLRTAGFYTLDFSKLRYVTILLMIPIMFVGGSSGGTAGGVKTTTMYIAVAYLFAMIRGQKHLVLFKRTIDKELVIKAFTLIFLNLIVLFLGVFLLALVVPKSQLLEYVFEATSALATVGLSVGLTPSMSVFAKVILICLMYIGRIGIITLIFSMKGAQKKPSNNVGYPNGNVLVG